MNPDLNQQPRRGRWPNQIDTALDRARKVAGMYRARLGAVDRAARDDCDQTAASFGETWMLDREDVVEPDRELTTVEAAELVNVPAQRIRKWAGLDHPEQPDQPLLPRFKMRGRERTYLAANVLEAAATMRRRRNTPA